MSDIGPLGLLFSDFSDKEFFSLKVGLIFIIFDYLLCGFNGQALCK